jgi:hypothetical protein
MNNLDPRDQLLEAATRHGHSLEAEPSASFAAEQEYSYELLVTAATNFLAHHLTLDPSYDPVGSEWAESLEELRQRIDHRF